MSIRRVIRRRVPNLANQPTGQAGQAPAVRAPQGGQGAPQVPGPAPALQARPQLGQQRQGLGRGATATLYGIIGTSGLLVAPLLNPLWRNEMIYDGASNGRFVEIYEEIKGVFDNYGFRMKEWKDENTFYEMFDYDETPLNQPANLERIYFEIDGEEFDFTKDGNKYFESGEMIIEADAIAAAKDIFRTFDKRYNQQRDSIRIGRVDGEVTDGIESQRARTYRRLLEITSDFPTDPNVPSLPKRSE